MSQNGKGSRPRNCFSQQFRDNHDSIDWSKGRKPASREVERCYRCVNPAGDEHTCPYQVEINDNTEFTCTCCPDCTYECAMDI